MLGDFDAERTRIRLETKSVEFDFLDESRGKIGSGIEFRGTITVKAYPIRPFPPPLQYNPRKSNPQAMSSDT
jgi:hypothetical protein